MRRASVEELERFFESRYKDYIKPKGWQTIQWEFDNTIYRVRPVTLVDLINILEILEEVDIPIVESVTEEEIEDNKENQKSEKKICDLIKEIENKKSKTTIYKIFEEKIEELSKKINESSTIINYKKIDRLNYLIKVSGFKAFKLRSIKGVYCFYKFIYSLKEKNKIPKGKYDEDESLFEDVIMLLEEVKNEIIDLNKLSKNLVIQYSNKNIPNPYFKYEKEIKEKLKKLKKTLENIVNEPNNLKNIREKIIQEIKEEIKKGK
ncbi:hypothetical protein [Hydrogenothermus marinus]|uniref:Uncharacterized protein n=1 Tax=Hydrogenothermus marinus TaxID=133270 RepID=A0A3M0BYG8_9AQUI|nr:hypothetical protein [Hydrogenothermus marinus]RMB00069.1 hypothetical protein CLV39_0038 [Hydrogenothermus marinus]